ncbi:HDOD domain-containing protein [Thioalkalivibrio sp. ALE19]|uniref:HDOD domain-containing protein n=1 Tax=Thioalkalivibrio sp. ALE19 TaxID=1266909 RepID=UPI000491CED4|nr:HDOD domain-containing protein [Thioalkalivibrio sp. ALE19]
MDHREIQLGNRRRDFVKDVLGNQESGRGEVREFLELIRSKVQNNRIRVPVFPSNAAEALRAFEADEYDIAEVARIAQKDPGMSARLIQQANSPAYCGMEKVPTVKMAITRMGLSQARRSIMTMAMNAVFRQDHDPVVNDYINAFWRHSIQVAALSHLLARCFDHLDADKALLTGLVHNVGALPVLAEINQYPVIYRNEELLYAVCAFIHEELSALVLQRWNFDSETIQAVAGYTDVERSPSEADPVTYLDVLQAADIESRPPKGSPLTHWQEQTGKTLPAVQRVAQSSDGELDWEKDRAGMQAINAMLA